ncbi:unnamed protein product [Macrosiphum euphorbiae]|uniref:Cytochrome P450 n=1 Tax=Macrosiphum euphorbiae TaxID=13131 RepID=A0AAV0XW65_9HEMI|nr:unnamed protein product [Macrosiphum euphorbiae]CAI6372182.1 unnamed protein product [Macrosiphum euphorbiae]
MIQINTLGIFLELCAKSVLNDQTQSGTPERSVFGSILLSSNLDMKEKKALLNEYITAGIKTFGNTLVFLLYLIAKHPEVQEKLNNEISRLAPAVRQVHQHYQ